MSISPKKVRRILARAGRRICHSRARRAARGRGASAKLAAVRRLEEIAERADRVVIQIKRRLAGEPNPNRLVSMFDPDARPISEIPDDELLDGLGE